MEEKFRLFQQSNFQKAVPISKKGKGRGKSTVQNDLHFSQEVEKEAQRRLRSFLQTEPSTSNSFDSQSSVPERILRDPPLPLPSAPPLEAGYWTEDTSSVGSRRSMSMLNEPLKVGATKKVYITNIEVTLNGTPLDQVRDKQNEQECMQAYWRLFTFNGQMNSLFTNGIREMAYDYSQMFFLIIKVN
jgi:hypothetical protein